MIRKEITHMLMVSIIISTMAACESSGTGGVNNTGPHSCTIPCLESTPTLDTSSITSASGGTVRVSFTLRGDVTNVSNVVVILAPTDILSGNPSAGGGSLLSPATASNFVDITVNSGTATGSYYPVIAITANSPVNSGNEYYLNPYASGTNYSYAEVISGSSSVPVVTNFAIPVLQVQ